MKTGFKLILIFTGIFFFEITSAQPPDDDLGDPCPGWPFCDSVSAISPRSVKTILNLQLAENTPSKETPLKTERYLKFVLNKEEEM